MHGRIKQLGLMLGLLVTFFSGTARAYDLRGYFPLYDGRFWNFKDPQGGETVTWAVNGKLTLKDGPIKDKCQMAFLKPILQ